MAAPFNCNEKVTIERLTGAKDPVYDTPLDQWEVVASRHWANVQEVLPSKGETTANGLTLGVQRARLRMRKNDAITSTMRVTLHGRDDRVMQIVAGPSLLDDLVHVEYMLEAYTS